jgi:hypothetical protein
MWERDEVDNGKWGLPESTANAATAPELTNDYITGPRVRDGKQKFV